MLLWIWKVTDHRWHQNMLRASLTYLAAPCMLCFCSYHIITSSGIGNVESICQLSLSLVFSIMCIWFWPNYFAMYRMFWIILFVVVDIFLQTSDVARYLLFTDRKKYPVKRGGTNLRCSTFVSKCEYANVQVKILINVDHLQDFKPHADHLRAAAKFYPLTPKIWFLIPPSIWHTIPCK